MRKPLILPAYFGALSLHKYNPPLLRFHRPQEVGIILPQVFIIKLFGSSLSVVKSHSLRSGAEAEYQ